MNYEKKRTHKVKEIHLYVLVLILLLASVHSFAQDALFTATPVSDNPEDNNIGSANTSRNVVADTDGNIYVVYANASEVRTAKSIDGGQSFLPSVLVASTAVPVEPELAVNDLGIVFVAWIENGSIHFSRSTDGGNNFSVATTFGSGIPGLGVSFNTGRVHMSTFGSNVYIIDVQGENLYSNGNSGIGSFTSISSGITMVYADVLTDQNGVVYAPMDNPTLRLFESTDQGQTLTETTLNPGGSVFFSSYALSDGPCGTFIFVSGSDTVGYQMNVATGETTQLTFGQNSTSEGRTLYADNKGTLIDGYKTSPEDVPGDLVISISSDQGTTFDPPIVVSRGNSQCHLVKG